MFKRHITKNLREREEVIETIRRSGLVEVGRILLSGALVLGPFFFLFPLFRLGSWGVALFSAALLAGIVLAARTFFVWSVNVFVLTNERIVDIDQRGFFTTVVSSASYEKIQDISFSVRGFWATIFHLGAIDIQTAGSETRLELSGVKDPQRVQERIGEIMKEFAPPSAQAAAERILTALAAVEQGRPTRGKPPR